MGERHPPGRTAQKPCKVRGGSGEVGYTGREFVVPEAILYVLGGTAVQYGWPDAGLSVYTAGTLSRPPPVDEVVASLKTCRARRLSHRATLCLPSSFKRRSFVADGSRLSHACSRLVLSYLSGRPGDFRFTCICERENYSGISIK